MTMTIQRLPLPLGEGGGEGRGTQRGSFTPTLTPTLSRGERERERGQQWLLEHTGVTS